MKPLTMKQGVAVTAAVVAVAIAVAVARQSGDTPAPLPVMIVWAFPQAQPGTRLNIIVNANTMVHDEMWESAEWQAAIGVVEGRFPVHVWQRDAGVWSRAWTVWIKADRYGWAVVPVTQLGGDMVGIEHTPALITREGVLPLGSQINNVSNDPVTLAPWRVEVRRER